MYRVILFLNFLTLILLSCSKGHVRSNNPVVSTNHTAAASPVIIPVLKGLDQNAVLKIEVSVTVGKSSLKDILQRYKGYC